MKKIPTLLQVLLMVVKYWLKISLCCLLIVPGISTATELLPNLLNRAQSLLSEQKPQEAFALLIEQELVYAGHPQYDYWLGIASLDNGNNGQAVFSLQRALATLPSMSGARLALARAYYNMGNDADAKKEFDYLLKSDPPPKVKSVVNQYLSAIMRRSDKYRTNARGFLQGGLGHDSNANGATDAQHFLGFFLSDKNVQTASNFAEFSGGGMVSVPLTPRYRWVSMGNGTVRSNLQAHFVDPTNVSVATGIAWERQHNVWNLFVGNNTLMLDQHFNRREWFVTGDYRWQVDQPSEYMLNARAAKISYGADVSVRDVNQYFLALGMRHKFSSGRAATFSLLGGVDRARLAQSPYDANRWGGRLSALIYHSNDFSTLLNFGYLHSQFDGKGFINNQGEPTQRKDTQTFIALKMLWPQMPWSNWQVKINASYVDNRSTVELFDYDRWEIGLFLQRRFE